MNESDHKFRRQEEFKVRQGITNEKLLYILDIVDNMTDEIDSLDEMIGRSVFDDDDKRVALEVHTKAYRSLECLRKIIYTICRGYKDGE